MKKIIFIGTDAIGKELLHTLHTHPQLEVVLVVTGRDKPMGRKLALTPNHIKQKAMELGLNLFQPKKINDSESVEQLEALRPDFLVVMAYGQIVSQDVLSVPAIDSLNVHTSLLPKYRGASPIQSALLNGDEKTGVSLMRMVERMDAGPIYIQFEQKIDHEDTAGTLWNKLAELSAKRIPDALIEVAEGRLKAMEQAEKEATYITKISKADGKIDWSESAEMIECKVRAFNPWPSAFTFFGNKRLKLHKTRVLEQTLNQPVGTTIKLLSGIGVVTGEGVLELMEVQLEGKKVQDMRVFLNGNRDFVDTILS